MASTLNPNPTPITHPDILKVCTVSATNNSILDAGSKRVYTFTPRNFTIVREIKDHLDPIETQANRKTVGQVVKENVFEIFYYLVIGGLEVGFIIWLTYILLPLSIAIAPITLLILFGFIGMSISEFRNRLNEKPQPKITPDRDFLFLQTDRTLLKDLDIVNAHATVVQTINAIHNTNNRLLHNTDTFALANAYDKYMDMLIFVLANKNKLSTRLIEKYTQSLHGKADAVLQEAANIFDSIKTQEEFVHKATEESRRLQQEMIDSEAESIMPPD